MAKGSAAILKQLSLRKRSKSVPHNAEAKFASDAASLYRLLAWLSPAYPTGAFSYSSGLEWAVEAGDVRCRHTLYEWLTGFLSDGPGFCDGVIFAHSYRACDTGNEAVLSEINDLAAALAPSRERYIETTAQGRAFVDVTLAAWPCPALECLGKLQAIAYPVAVGVAAAGHAIPLEPAISAYLQSLTANWISAAVRLVPLGQTDGQRATAALEPVIASTIVRALAGTLDEIGGAVFRADIATMRHEAQYTRLFRS
jgi:urease accessory protein